MWEGAVWGSGPLRNAPWTSHSPRVQGPGQRPAEGEVDDAGALASLDLADRPLDAANDGPGPRQRGASGCPPLAAGQGWDKKKHLGLS